MTSPTKQVAHNIQHRITDEIFNALGWSTTGLLRRALGPLFGLPTRRFAHIFARADVEVGLGGMNRGCRSAMNDFAIELAVRGNETVPTDGPLLVVSNHPGAYDSICLAASVPRPDIKIVVFDTPVYHATPNAERCFLCVTRDPAQRMTALKGVVDHLHAGGSLLQFGSGTIDPDPAISNLSEDELQKWSPSLEIMLRKAPDTRLVLAVVSGVVLKRFAEHPLTRLRRTPLEVRRLAEFIQVIQHLLRPDSVKIQAHLSFAPPVTLETLQGESGGGRLLPVILARERALMAEHRQVFGLTHT